MQNTLNNRIYHSYTSVMSSHHLSYSDEQYIKNANLINRRLGKWIPKDKNSVCLDLGCGCGEFLYLLKILGFKMVVGVDLSPEQVTFAKNFNDNVVLGDVKSFLRSNVNKFDLITAFDILEHFGKDELVEVMDLIYLSLKPNGQLIVQVPNAESPWSNKIRYGDLTHELCFDTNSLDALLKICGFKNAVYAPCGPIIHGLKSLVRFLIWKFYWFFLALWNLSEVGNLGSGIYTRVILLRTFK